MMDPLITANRLTQAVSVVLFALVVLFTVFVGYRLPRADWGRFNFIRNDGAARLLVEFFLVLAFIALLSILSLYLTPFLDGLFGLYV